MSADDLSQAIKSNTTSFVIDAEAVAWDTEERRLLEFQKLSTRKRKDVKAEDIKVKVHLFAFDLLYLNGEVRPRSLSRSSSTACTAARTVALPPTTVFEART